MGRLLFCRYCLHGQAVTGGYLPDHCDGCGREGLWSTEEPAEAFAAGYVWTDYDRLLMAVIEQWGRAHFKGAR